MEGIMNRGPVVVEKDGHDGYKHDGLLIFAIIFLAVLFIAMMFRRDHREGGLESLVPLAMLGQHGHKQHGYPADDWKLVELIKDQKEDTGKIIHAMDLQNCTTQKMIEGVIAHQSKCSWDAERLYNQRYVDELRDRCAEKDRMLIEKDNRILHERTLERLCHIESRMLKQPHFLPYGGYPATECGPGRYAAAAC